MECAHCQKTFQESASFDEHCKEHKEIQRKLQRPATRTYGARYVPSQHALLQDSTKKPSSRASDHSEDREQEAPHAESSEDNIVPGLDPRIKFIMEHFASYDGTGMTEDSPSDREYSCPDCDFKFRTLKDRDEHRLSRFCQGCHVKAFVMVNDHSKPTGYQIENVLLPFDWKLYRWESVCKKCGECFTSDADMKQHELTHLIMPSRCLHCSKVFSSHYELEDHYEWHDDMEYRNHRDNALRSAASSETKRDYVEIHIPNKTTDLGHGILHCPDPTPAIPPRGDRQILGFSFISAEDIERDYAPEGKLTIPDGGYLSVPPWVSDSMMSEAIEKLHLEREKQDKTRIPLKTSEDKEHPSVVKVKAHGKPGAVQVTDTSGRVRWLGGEGFGKLGRMILTGNNEYDSYMEKAIDLQQNGDIKGALRFYLVALNEASTKPSTVKDMDEYVTLTSIAACYTRLHDFDNTVDYNIRALRLAERLLGKDDLNIFLRINDLAVAYEEHGKLQDAHNLYARSLSGKMKRLGEGDASTLMTMQELGSIKRRLNHLLESRILLERAYLGYENLQEPNEEMAYGTLCNIASVYKQMGLVRQAKELLQQTIPRMRQVLGLANKITVGSIYNFLLMEQTCIPSEILTMIQEIQEKRYETGRLVLEWLARHYYDTHQIRRAVGLMKTLAEWEGLDLDQSVSYLSLAGACYLLLDDLDESCKMYELMYERAALAVEAQRQALRAHARMSIRDIRTRQQQLLDERAAWGLNEPRLGISEPGSVRSLEEHMLRLFAEDPMFVRKPKPLTAKQIFLDPEGFATFRIWMDPTKLVSFSFIPSADLQCWIVEPDGTKVVWSVQENCSDCYFYKDMGERYLVIAPGAELMGRIVEDYQRDTGMYKDARMQVPDKGLQEYLQVTQGRGGGTARLAVVMILWEQ
ncbi:nephrocystin-3 [Aspergillus udagawae]|nr:nephrocystin-3 [Aspergillus udagawae]